MTSKRTTMTHYIAYGVDSQSDYGTWTVIAIAERKQTAINLIVSHLHKSGRDDLIDNWDRLVTPVSKKNIIHSTVSRYARNGDRRNV